jgi:hypothetical protein
MRASSRRLELDEAVLDGDVDQHGTGAKGGKHLDQFDHPDPPIPPETMSLTSCDARKGC